MLSYPLCKNEERDIRKHTHVTFVKDGPRINRNLKRLVTCRGQIGKGRKEAKNRNREQG